MGDSCSSLTCEPGAITVTFSPDLFGEAVDDTNWHGDVQPIYDNNTNSFFISTSLGDASVVLDESKLADNIAKFLLPITLGGAARSRARSDLIQIDNTYDLDGQVVETTPYGITIAFSCQYPTKISLSTDTYSVEDVSISDSLTSTGDWSSAFGLTLIENNKAAENIMLGDILGVRLSWQAGDLGSKMSFQTDECTVTHGDLSVAVVKAGCYAGVIQTEAFTGKWTGLALGEVVNSFQYKTFRSPGLDTKEQTISCSLTVCPVESCYRPASDEACPSEGHDFLYHYYAPKN